MTAQTLLLDVGGVLGTDGWDRFARRRAAVKFGLEWDELEERHHLMFETYEEGKLTLGEYLGKLVFYRKRPFTPRQFRDFIFAQSRAAPEMLGLVRRLKGRHRLKIAVLSNEGRELNAYRTRKFKLPGLVDFFVTSCFVHMRKPDPEIFRLALDLAQTPAKEVIYIENTPMFVRIAEDLGMRSVFHQNYHWTREKLASLGLDDPQGRPQS